MHYTSRVGIISSSGYHIAGIEAWGTVTDDGTLAVANTLSNRWSFVSGLGVSCLLEHSSDCERLNINLQIG